MRVRVAGGVLVEKLSADDAQGCEYDPSRSFDFDKLPVALT